MRQKIKLGSLAIVLIVTVQAAAHAGGACYAKRGSQCVYGFTQGFASNCIDPCKVGLNGHRIVHHHGEIKNAPTKIK